MTKQNLVKQDKASRNLLSHDDALFVKASSSKQLKVKSPINKINVIADSHGRGIPLMIRNRCEFRAQGLIRPGACVSDILDINNPVCKVQEDTVSVILAGSNDVYNNNSGTLMDTF